MADKAEYYLEQSLEECEDLLKKSVFNKVLLLGEGSFFRSLIFQNEIRSIIQKRTRFEHALARRNPQKADFTRYIKYEKALESLRKKRVERLSNASILPSPTITRLTSSEIGGRKTISDWAGPRKISFLYRRATNALRGDISLWNEYIGYVVEQGQTMGALLVFTSAVNIHPYHVPFWIAAANFEMLRRRNMPAARAIMQRCIRFNQQSNGAWVSYLNLEMEFLDKICARRRVLRLDGPIEENEDCVNTDNVEVNTDADVDFHGDENDDFIQLPSAPQGGTGIDTGPDQSLGSLAQDVKLQGAVPKIIFDAALEKVEDKLSCAVAMCDVFEKYVERVPCAADLHSAARVKAASL